MLDHAVISMVGLMLVMKEVVVVASINNERNQSRFFKSYVLHDLKLLSFQTENLSKVVIH